MGEVSDYSRENETDIKEYWYWKKYNRDQAYENWFVFDDVSNMEVLEGFLNSNINEMNYLASKLNDMSEDEYQKFRAAVKMGDHTGSIQELINLTDMVMCAPPASFLTEKCAILASRPSALKPVPTSKKHNALS